MHVRDSLTGPRRTIAMIASALAAEFAVIGLRQHGVIRRLPDLPIRGFDSNAVITARSAYPLGIPDSTLAIAGLGAILAAASAQRPARGLRRRVLDAALLGGAAAGAGGALYYLHDMVVRQKRLCAYCLVAVTGFLALAPLAVRAVR